MPSELEAFYKLLDDKDPMLSTIDVGKIVVPFDDSAVDHVTGLDFGDRQAGIKALEVEELINITSSRVNTCLAIRERAQDLQIRALSDAVEVHIQEAGIGLQLDIDALALPAKDDQATKLQDLRDDMRKLLMLRPSYLKARSQEQGHGSNYGERYSFLKRMFLKTFEDAFIRAKVAANALRTVYGIDHPLPQLKPNGYLNELTIWTQDASDKLEIELEKRRRVTVAVSIGSPDETVGRNPLKLSEFTAQREAGIFSIDFKPSFTALNLKSPRLRSLCIQIIPKDATHLGKYYPAIVTPPASTLAPGDNAVPLLAIAGEVSSCWDLASTEFHNIDPVSGSWGLRLKSHPSYGPADAADVLAHIVFHFTLSVER